MLVYALCIYYVYAQYYIIQQIFAHNIIYKNIFCLHSSDLYHVNAVCHNPG